MKMRYTLSNPRWTRKLLPTTSVLQSSLLNTAFMMASVNKHTVFDESYMLNQMDIIFSRGALNFFLVGMYGPDFQTLGLVSR